MPPRKRKAQSTSRSAHPSTSSPSKRSRHARSKVGSSIWNSPDDWNALVAASSLSTSSISTRRPRLRGVPSLVKCSTEAAARGFKRLWEGPEQVLLQADYVYNGGGWGRGGRGGERGEWWKAGWEGLGEHLKVAVRGAVFRLWGGYLTVDMLSQMFIFPPHIYLPTAQLPSIHDLEGLKSLHPPRFLSDSFTSLYLTDAPRASDVALAGMVWWLPNLVRVNLKGCSGAGPKLVDALVKRCLGLKRVNLRGTKVGEREVKALLDAFGGQLEQIKVDGEGVRFSNINDTFASSPYPRLTHLCLPGDLLNAPATDFRARARAMGQTIAHPAPRPTPADSVLQWHTLSETFPSLTQLALPGLLVPPGTVVGIPARQLVKFKIGPGGPPVPLATLAALVEGQNKSLKSLHLGHLMPHGHGDTELDQLVQALEGCTVIEEFRLQVDRQGSQDTRCDRAMGEVADWIFDNCFLTGWRHTLKRLSIALPPGVKLAAPTLQVGQVGLDSPPALEQLELPGVDMTNLAEWIAQFPRLRSLDISNTKLTDDDVFAILDKCPLLSTIDLTACRGINVRNRRNIFQAWAEARGSS